MTMVASFLMVGGQLLMPGVAALCRNWPDWDDWQVLQIVIISPFVLMLPYVWWVPPSELSTAGGGGGILLLSQAMACTLHTALHRTEHNLLLVTNNALFLFSFVFFPPSVSSSCFHNTFWFCPTIPTLSTSFPSLSLQDFSWVVALVAGHPALQTIQSHDAAHHQQEPGWHDNSTEWSSYRWEGFQEGRSAKMKKTKSILL